MRFVLTRPNPNEKGMPVTETAALLEKVYETMEGSEMLERYMERHEVRSAGVLTVTDDERAAQIADYLAPRIEGRTVIEVGGGIGILACHLAGYAKRVWCIEADPNWSWIFAGVLLRHKPKNLSFLFGAADEFYGAVRGDVAIYCTHSDAAGMGEVARRFAPVVIDVYDEMVPEHRAARSMARR